jgi:iron complex outermembrane receptor protein
MKHSACKLLATTATALALSLPAVAWAQEPTPASDIVVTAQRENQTQVLREGSLGVLGEKSAMDVPFAVKAYDSTLILNQQPQTLGQVLQNDPSIRTSLGFANASEQFVIRGFPLNGDDIAIDGLYGVTPRQLISPELYDQVQVLNGASAFLFGAAPGGSGIGGTVNLMPKRAGRDLMRVTANYTSDAHFGGAFDVAHRFGDDDAFGIRVNGAGRWGDISIDNEYRSSEVLGLSTDWHSDSVRLSLDAAYQRSKVSHMRPMVQVTDPTALPEAPNASLNYGQPWNFTTLRDIFGILKGEVDITDGVLFYASVGARDSAERGYYQQITVTNSATGDAFATGSTIPRNDNNYAEQAGFRFKKKIGSVTNELNVGLSGSQQENRNAFGFGNFAGSPTNLYDPVVTPLPDFSYSAQFFPGGNLADPFPISKTKLFSMFASDTIGAWDDKVLLTVGLRRQRMTIDGYSYADGSLSSSYDQEATTPIVGLVVKPSEHISLYANRIEGLSQGPTAPLTATNGSIVVNHGEIFAPFKSVQYEFGGKVEYGKYAASIALFQIKKPNGITSPVDPADPTGLQIFSLNGEQRNQGVEVSFDGEPTKGLRIIAGLTYLNAEITKSQDGLLNGNKAQGVPEFSGNLNVEWDLPFFRGTTLTGRMLYTDHQFFDQTNTLSIPSWATFDLGARYVFVTADHPVTLRFNVDNVANKSYWASAFGNFGGQLTQGMPRTFKASITTEF